MKLITSGPTPAKIMIIGEKVGYAEVEQGRPMAGMAGREFDLMLTAAGLNRTDVFVTNVAHEPFGDVRDKIIGGFWKAMKAKAEDREKVGKKYPCDQILDGLPHLDPLIEKVNPDIIVACGSVALWALIGEDKITKWRGSIMEYKGRKLIPTYNPATILYGNYSWKWDIIQDFRRVAYESRRENPRKIYFPERDYIVRPDVDTVLEKLAYAKGRTITVDIETRGGQISCLGIGFDKKSAICIPFMCIERPEGYWSEEEEIAITLAMRDTLSHPGTKCVFQNAQFDCQYIAFQWGFMPNVSDDTMIMQHTAFPNARKSLDYLASYYCDYYCYWKDDGKEWNPKAHSEDQHWIYNCDDLRYTYECYETLNQVLTAYKLTEQYRFQMSLFPATMDMMLRGIKIDTQYRNELDGILLHKLRDTSIWLETALGHPFNPDDNHKNGQMRRLFYKDFGLKPILHRKTKNPTLDKDALEELRQKNPILRPLIDKIEEYRSYRVFRSNFILKQLDPDDRMRSTILIPGTESLRFSSSENPWGRGANMQTISKGTEKD